MDLEQLDINEVRRVSQFVDLLGMPASVDEFGSCLRVARAVVSIYEREMVKLQQSIRAHEGG
jgi:hypothetical protein